MRRKRVFVNRVSVDVIAKNEKKKKNTPSGVFFRPDSFFGSPCGVFWQKKQFNRRRERSKSKKMLKNTRKVIYYKGESDGCERNFIRIFGRTLSDEEIFRIAGAPSGSLVTIGTDGSGVLFDVMEPVRLGWVGQVRINFSPRLGRTLWIDDWRILRRRWQKQGIGTALFARLTEAARSLEIATIVTTVRHETNENGFYTFRRFGFVPTDGAISAPSVEIELYFDLAGTSLSMKCFEKYLCEKNILGK